MDRVFYEPGKFYLFACPWFWTFVGRYVCHSPLRSEILIDDALYFTYTGATFDVLCTRGLVEDSKYHVCGEVIIPAGPGPKFAWRGPTPWAKEAR